MSNDRVFLSGNNGWVAEIEPNNAVVIYGPPDTTFTEAITDPADNPRLSVADAYEQLTWDGEETDLPDDADLALAGIDPRDMDVVTWKEIAVKLLREPHSYVENNKPKRVTLSADDIEELRHLKARADDPNDPVSSASIIREGVEIRIAKDS